MGAVRGNATTFASNSFILNGGRLKIVPSSPAVTGATYLLTDQPVIVPFTDGTGAFEATLVATDTTRPGTFYTLILESPDPEGNFKFFAKIPGVLRVPSGPGPFDIVDLIVASANPAMAWVGPTYPSNAPPELGTWWLVTDPASPDYGWLMEWS